MNDFIILMNMIYNHMNTPFTVWGFTFSLWQVYCSTLILIIIVWFISEMLGLNE